MFFWLFIDDDDFIRKVENSTFTDFCAISAISFGLCVSILVWLEKKYQQALVHYCVLELAPFICHKSGARNRRFNTRGHTLDQVLGHVVTVFLVTGCFY